MRYAALVLLLIPVFFMSISASGGNVEVKISSPSVVLVGENVSVYVSVNNISLFNAADYVVTYNSSILQLLGVLPGNVNGTEIPVNFSFEEGRCKIVNNMGLHPVNGSGFLAILNFSVLGEGFSHIAIEGNLSDVYGGGINASWRGKYIRATSTLLKITAEMENGSILASIDVINIRDFGSVNLTVLYDSTFLNPVSVINGSIDGSMVNVEASFLQGRIKMVGWVSGENVTGNGTIATIRFFPRTNGITFINLTGVTLSNGEAEEIYAVVENGSIVIAGNIPPVANFSFQPENPFAGEDVVFNASPSYDEDGQIINYTWDFGDGGTGYGRIVNHTYSMNGSYTVNLSITDDGGAKAYMEKIIEVQIMNHPPAAPFNPSPANGSTDVAPDVELSWECNDEDGDALSYDIYFGTSFPLPLVVHNHSLNHYSPSLLQYSTTYYWQVIAWDSRGAKSTGGIWHFTTSSPPDYTLSISSSPQTGGYVTLSPSGGTYEKGTVVTLTAHPYSGYAFSHWGGDASGSGATIQIIMDSDKNVVAYFEPLQSYYTLSISSSPQTGGYVTLSPSGGTYEKGTVVTLTAHPYSGYAFSHWGGDVSGSGATIQIIMDSDKDVVAYFIASSPPPENHPPFIEITAPSNGSIVYGNVIIEGTAYDEDGDSLTVEVRVDEGEWKEASGAATWSYSINISVFGEGMHVIYARAYDGKEYSQEESIQVVVEGMNHAPKIYITSPLNGSTVSGDIEIKGSAFDEDNDTLIVEVRVDEGEWKEASGAATWSYFLDTTKLSNGAHTIYARAYDGKSYGTSSIKIIVDNGKPGGGGGMNIFLLIVLIAGIVAVAAVWFYRRK